MKARERAVKREELGPVREGEPRERDTCRTEGKEKTRKSSQEEREKTHFLSAALSAVRW